MGIECIGGQAVRVSTYESRQRGEASGCEADVKSIGRLRERAGQCFPQRPLDIPIRPQPGNPDLACKLVVRLVAARFRIAEDAILGATRGEFQVARARQIAMYLLHTSLSISFLSIAEFFARDRTTVSHACRLIEDGRDDGSLNAALCELEGILELVGPLAGFHWHSTQRRGPA